jgi:hypothetical protein
MSSLNKIGDPVDDRSGTAEDHARGPNVEGNGLSGHQFLLDQGIFTVIGRFPGLRHVYY